jgi:hypothetical protein
MELKTGAYVVLWQRNEDIPIKARRGPERVGLRKPDAPQENVIGVIPRGTSVLYISSHSDGLRDAIAKRGRGPSGWIPKELVYHYILWADRPCWVSSEDCELRDVNEVPRS